MPDLTSRRLVEYGASVPISTGNNNFVSKINVDTIDKVDSNGLLSIGSFSFCQATIVVVKGMQIDQGYFSPQFVTSPEDLGYVAVKVWKTPDCGESCCMDCNVVAHSLLLLWSTKEVVYHSLSI